jgi:hypothetical protein
MKVTYRDMYCSYLCITMYHSYLYNTTEIVYDNKNLHITELEDTRLEFILFYFILFISNKR